LGATDGKEGPSGRKALSAQDHGLKRADCIPVQTFDQAALRRWPRLFRKSGLIAFMVIVVKFQVIRFFTPFDKRFSTQRMVAFRGERL
jgi:hypothetical protein